ncbi:hypothetical protein C8R45DRAFT_1036288 [Mycena sanguinolenta]|nr:hypothetical protein C8R45DRAFT_1036288 [Mycena sanguinolenta]
MDADRKSTVSSFYGGRKGSMDALNQDYPSPTGDYEHQQPNRMRDDASSFFNPRGSMDPFAGRTSNAGGYNRNSFFPAAREEPLKGGRDEEEEGAWDVYADFNNAGPKYSSAFGTQDTGYQSLGHGTPKVEETPGGPVEMVTVPALGPEWKKSEMHDMTKAAKREKRAERRKQLWQDWTRGNRGGKWFTKRVIVFTCFGLIAIIAVVIGICLPRVPSFALSDSTPLANATGDWANEVPAEFSRIPANFSFPAFADLQVDTTSNYLPLHFKHLHAEVYDLTTGFLIGSGDMKGLRLPAKSYPDIQLPLNFTYVATNDSDTTWLNWYGACQNPSRVTGGVRPGVRFRLDLTMNILGLPGSYGASTQVTNGNCPIELPSNSA